MKTLICLTALIIVFTYYCLTELLVDAFELIVNVYFCIRQARLNYPATVNVYFSYKAA